MTQWDDSADGAERLAQIETMLANYPNLSKEHLATVIGWFRNEASAFDVATIASNEAVAEAYRQFRADHIEPMSGRDVVNALLFAAGAAVFVALLVWVAL